MTRPISHELSLPCSGFVAGPTRGTTCGSTCGKANGLANETDLTGNIQAVPLADGLGSVRALTDPSGAVIQTYRTDQEGEFGLDPDSTRCIPCSRCGSRARGDTICPPHSSPAGDR